MVTGQLGPKDLGTLLNELCKISPKWEIFGMQLGIQNSILKTFRRSDHTESLQSLCDTLEEWLNNCQPTTWLEIVKVLKLECIGESQLAMDIEVKHCSNLDVKTLDGKNRTCQIT